MISPGASVTEFTTKQGLQVVVRWAQVSDAEALMNFINTFSKETSFTRFNDEQLSLSEEEAYLESEVASMRAGDLVKIFCWFDNKIVGVCDVHRDKSLLSRKLHTGIFGLIVAQEMRGQGVGEMLMSTIIQLATQELSGIQLIKLDCFANNQPALALYKKLGFKEVGRIPNALKYKDEFVDEVIMTRAIHAV